MSLSSGARCQALTRSSGGRCGNWGKVVRGGVPAIVVAGPRVGHGDSNIEF